MVKRPGRSCNKGDLGKGCPHSMAKESGGREWGWRKTWGLRGHPGHRGWDGDGPRTPTRSCGTAVFGKGGSPITLTTVLRSVEEPKGSQGSKVAMLYLLWPVVPLLLAMYFFGTVLIHLPSAGVAQVGRAEHPAGCSLGPGLHHSLLHYGLLQLS